MFKFKLASVLSLKEKMEDSKKRELGKALMEAEQAAKEKERLLKAQQDLLENVRAENSGTVNVTQLRLIHHYHEKLTKELKQKDNDLQQLERKVTERREDLREAVKERKILDNLKAIEMEAYQEEEKRLQQNIVDEMITYKYGVKGGKQ